MALKADTTASNNSIVVNGVTTPVGDIQVVELATVAAGVVTEVATANPLPTTVVTSPAAARTSDSVSAAAATDVIMNNLTALTPKFASIAVAASGDNAVVTAVGGKKIRVLRYAIVASAAVAVKFRSATTDITGAMSLAANGGVSEAYCPVGLFETAVGAALNINLGSANAIAGSLTYVEV